MPRIIIAGGGIAGLEALLALRAHLGTRAEIELLEAGTALSQRQHAVAGPFGARHLDRSARRRRVRAAARRPPSGQG